MILIFFVLFCLANFAALLRAQNHAGRWGWGPKVALGLPLFVVGQLTVNAMLVAIPRILYDALPTLGPNWPTAIGAATASLWLGGGLYWIYRRTYRRLGGVADAG